MLDAIVTFAFVPLVAAVAWHMRPAYGAFTVLTFLVAFGSGGLAVMAMTRYMLMLVPCYMLLGARGGGPGRIA